MSWISLTNHMANLPLVLSGPIVRRVEPGSVTVWLALKEPRRVTLRVCVQDDTGTLNPCIEGTHTTVRLGDHLHIVAVTAHATSNEQALAWGKLYYYDLFFRSATATNSENEIQDEAPPHLSTPGILTPKNTQGNPLQGLVYEGHPLPSFVMPPEDINQLRIVHGSCRKMHGDGREMLSTIDTM